MTHLKHMALPSRALLVLLLGLLLGLGAVVGGIGRPAHAATTLTVTNCSNDTQLQADVSTANSENDNDTITFACSGAIPLTSTLTISGSMTLDGSGQTVTLDGQHQQRVLFVIGVTLTLKALTIANGSTSFDGGGIANEGTLNISTSTVSGNSAFRNGGGILNPFGGTLNISTSTVSGNSTNNGGGIYNQGMLTLSNSTVSGNSAALEGGGILNIGTVSISTSTVSGNSAPFDEGGGIANLIGTVNIGGSIVAANTGSDCTSPFRGFPLTDQGYNLESGTFCGFTGTGSLQNTAPKLDPNGLQNNGGPTQTLALEPDSAAVDHIPVGSSCPATDQRGVTRPQGELPKCDIGAFEMTATDGLTVMIQVVNSFHLATGLQTSLDSQLQTVLADLQANNTAQACSDLSDFINHVKAQSGKMLMVAQANQLLAAATQIQAVLGC